MNHMPTTSNVLGSRPLRSAEWLAENAYIAPGFHRLLTAGGLALGLWGGRAMMDVVTARSASGDEQPRAKVPEILRPLHGILRFNPYSDDPTDRWKTVADKMAPLVLGGVGAFLGSKAFFYGKLPFGQNSAFSAATQATLKKFGAGKMSFHVADSMSSLKQSDAINTVAAANFSIGSASGTHLGGAAVPISNSMSAVRFQLGAERRPDFAFIPFLGKFLNRLSGNFSYGSRRAAPAMRDTLTWARSNLVKQGDPANWLHDEMLHIRARDALQDYGNVTEAELEKLSSAYRSFINAAYREIAPDIGKASEKELLERANNYLTGKNGRGHSFLDEGHDRFLHDYGFDLTRLTPGGNGAFTALGRLGSTKGEQEAENKWRDYLKDKFGLDYGPSRIPLSSAKRTAIYAGGLGGLAGMLAVGGYAANHMNKRIDRKTAELINHTESTDPINPETRTITAEVEKERQQKKESGNLVDWINDKPLGVMQWISRVAITPPSMHRFMNAAYLSGALWAGMQITNAMTGRRLTAIRAEDVTKSLLERKDVFFALRPLHNIMHYMPGSSLTADRWKQAAHFILPVAIGSLGTYSGSAMFFRDRTHRLEKPKTLEEYTDRIAMEQSKFYAGATAITSIFNTGSGVHLLPVFNYSSNLHNRYLLASGQQVAMPGLGKWWSGNAGLSPWGVNRGMQYTINYLTRNPDPRPLELPSLVHSIIGKLYPQLTEEVLLAKKQAMLNEIYQVRDSYLVERHIPTSKQPAVKEAMQKLMSGEGFEKLLQQVGLNPAEADLASNGASGRIANFFGQKHKVNQLTEEYHHKLSERLAKEKGARPQDYLRQLLDKGPAPADTSFSDRVKSTPTTPALAV